MTLAELIERSPIGMMTTHDAEGQLISRPMRALETRDGRVWFLTRGDSNKVRDIVRDARVNVAFVLSSGEYASVAGRAEITDDRKTVERLWDASYRAWFPEGIDDPDLVLLHLTVERGDYWEAPATRAQRLLDAVTSTLSGQPNEIKKQPIDP
jgi:general stress protein 26